MELGKVIEKRTISVSFKVSKSEAERIARGMRETGLTISDYCRSKVLYTDSKGLENKEA